MSQSGEYFIPEISEERLTALLRQMWPVVRFGPGRKRDPSGELYYIYLENARNVAFTWAAEPAKKAGDLIEIARIRTLHTFGYHGFFKPSVAEVVAQIPEHLLDAVIAFETHGPETTYDLNREIDALNEGFHVAETILYTR